MSGVCSMSRQRLSAADATAGAQCRGFTLDIVSGMEKRIFVGRREVAAERAAGIVKPMTFGTPSS